MNKPAPALLENAAPRDSSDACRTSSPPGPDWAAMPGRLEYIIDALGVGFWDFEVASGAFWRSAHCDRILGASQQLPRWTLSTFLEHILAADRPAVHHAFQRAIEEGAGWGTECRVQCRDGEIRWIAIQGQAHRYGPQAALRLVGSVRDITSQKQALLQLSQARQAAEAVSRADHSLLATLGEHLCRSLDLLLDAFGRLMSSGGNACDADRSLSVLQANGLGVTELLNGIVAFIRDEGGIEGGPPALDKGGAVSTDLHAAPAKPQAAGDQSGDRNEAAYERRSPAREPRPARVLLVDDVASVRSVNGEHLKRLGVEVDEAGDGKSGYEMALQSRAEGRPYGLILMDLIMPVMNGVQATRELRRAGWHGPVVALTAHALEGDRESCLEAGCDDCLGKPVTGKQLELIVRRFLREQIRERPAPR